MKKQRKSILVLAFIMVFVAACLFLPGLIGAGDLEPGAAPGPTMKTLDQIPPTWSRILPVAERFELVMGDAAVLDKETGLVWAQNANILGGRTWQSALEFSRNLSIADRKGWRLPTVEELASLIDSTQMNPSLPAGHPFINVQSSIYWSSNTNDIISTRAWAVDMGMRIVSHFSKTSPGYAWQVRGGN